MTKVSKKIIAVLVCLVLIIGAMAISALAANETVYGEYGDNLTWIISDNGTLTISGEGEMSENAAYPWSEHKDRVVCVVIEDGVTTVGADAFNGLKKLTDVILSDSVTKIGSNAFKNCNKLANIKITESISTIGDGAFAGCKNLIIISFEGDAPEFGRNVFDDITATAYYPENSETWTNAVKESCGGKITWIGYTLESSPVEKEVKLFRNRPVVLSDDALDADLAKYEVLSTTKSEDGVVCTSFRYGKSERGRDLVCWSIQQGNFDRTILLNCAIHGWEDAYAADGKLLVKLGNALVEHYSASANLKNCRLLIIPCANPDGIEDGYTEYGFGRCNAKGIDLNRDFDANHVVYTNARNYTPYPFSAVESRALRDLVWASDPGVVIDFHGWLNYTIGSSDLADIFTQYVGLRHKSRLTTSASGYFTYWAQLQGAEALLVEFKDTSSIVHKNVINAVDAMIDRDYVISEPSDFPTPILAYNHSTTAKTTVYESVSSMGGSSYGSIYVDDQCTINAVNISGNYVNVTYPTSSGTKKGYAYLNEFFPSMSEIGEPYNVMVSANTDVYRKADMKTYFSYADPDDTLTVVGKDGDNRYQVMFYISSGTSAGKYKLGWIYGDNIIKDKELESIEVASLPTKTSYYVGDTLDTVGLTLTAAYSDGTTETISEGYTCTPNTLDTAGTQIVTVTYNDKTVSFEVTVETFEMICLGDVDLDGNITNTDLVMVARYIVGLYDVESEEADIIASLGDMDNDGKITNTDLISIARVIVGIVE